MWPLRVLANAVSAHTGGGLTYAYEQIRELGRLPELELTVLATDPLAQWLVEDAPRVLVISQPRRSLPARILWEQLAIPRLARDQDVVYMLGNFAVFGPGRRQVVALQNPNHFGAAARKARADIPSRRTRGRLLLESAVARASVRHADRAIAVSHTLHAAVKEDMGAATNVRTVPSGTPALRRVNGSTPRNYALAVAHDYPHKDWDRLIATFAEDAELPPLVLVGECRTRKRHRQIELSLARETTGRVTLLGGVTDRAHLASLYRGARCFLAHSRLEAFPLTPYEALSVGLPVVASDIAAHREVCGPHAIYYDLDDARSLSQAVRAATSGAVPPRPCEPRSWQENASAVADTLREAARA